MISVSLEGRNLLDEYYLAHLGPQRHAGGFETWGRSYLFGATREILKEWHVTFGSKLGPAIVFAALSLMVSVSSPAASPPAPKSNGLALTPPLGWSSWNNFGEDINEQLIVETIDAMVANGMRDAGYVYVNLDDGWQRYKGTRRDHPLEVDPKKFPRGIAWLSNYAHERGMKLGIYSGPGQSTCAGYTGSEGHEAEDARMFASWNIDHLKYDSCCSHREAPKDELQKIFRTMSEALMAQKRGIVLHACHCGWGDIWEWAGCARDQSLAHRPGHFR